MCILLSHIGHVCVLHIWLFFLQLTSDSLCSETSVSNAGVRRSGRGVGGSACIKESGLEVRY
jgi:hypothetical protein